MSSNNDRDDLLSGLLGSSRRRRGKKATPGVDPSSKTAAPKGLKPSDVLFLPSAQREIINWLSRRAGARFGEIQQALAGEADHIGETLSTLKEAGYVRETLVDGEISYQVVFEGTVSRGGRGLTKETWERLELDNVTFLQQLSLFRGLSRQEIESVADKLEERRYSRNEVILWQGDLTDSLYLIKMGVVGVTRLSNDRTPQLLAYLKQGQVLGEMGLLTAQSSTATVTALTKVEMLIFKRQDFFELLSRHSSTAIELARVLGQRLSETSARLTSTTADTNLCLLLSVGGGTGGTTIGSALALTLAHTTQGRTVYTEYPAYERLPELFGFAQETESHPHPGGYDVLVPRNTPGLPTKVRATLVMDQLMSSYANIVLSTPGDRASKMSYALERADQVVIVAPPDQESWAQVLELSTFLKPFIRPEKTKLFTVINRGDQKDIDVPSAGQPNFDLPFLETMPSLADQRMENLPKPLAEMTRSLADSLGYTSQVGIYVPTTIGVDQCADTTACVEKTLAFLGELFGGATCTEAQGVWNSDEVGLVNETIHIVQSFAAPSDLDKHLPDVIEYVESLKQELQQEAMALEVNQKLMLI